ncbi:hypothetical protein CFP56_044058 [Quercus suber]|uniref:F-box domain-containing protein n=1 Tax=Quercus suber TaxID=58331 RepID=A0AAW0LI85_QUESU
MKGCKEKSRRRINNERENLNWSMSVLPYVLTSDIILRLPMKKIFQCRFVCKTWHNLLSGQDSDVLQSARVRDTVVFRSTNERCQSDIYLVELDLVMNKS